MPRRLFSLLSGRRWWRAWLVLTLAVCALAFAVRSVPALRTARLPTGGAQWIWRDMDRRDLRATVFYAARDFSVATPPAEAQLLITADEEYVVTLNGKRIAAGTYLRRDGGTILDRYEVGPFLRPGGNRLLVEVRSGRGSGGLLAALKSGESTLVATDESWRVFRSHELGLLRGWLPVAEGEDGGEPAFAWGYPPIGRWGAPRLGKAVPTLAPSSPLVAVSARPLALPGRPVLYDWGRPVEGYLTLDLPPAAEQGTGLLYTGLEPPDPRSARFMAPVLVQPGRHDWLDARPRRFRYAVVLGIQRPARAAVLPAPVRSEPQDPDELKVFGVEGPPLRTPVEDEVWSKLQSLPGVARRKEL